MENTKTPMKDKETKEWYKVEIRELIRKNLDKIHRKVGDSYGIDVSFLHKMISEYVDQELDKAREEKIQNIFTKEECVIVEPRYISDWSDKYNKHFKCNRCKSKCLIPVIEPLVVICPKCGELDLDEIS